MARGDKGKQAQGRGGDTSALADVETAPLRLRIDKWLWQARFFKTRALAAALAESGRLRVNGQKISRASREIGPGDVLTFPQGQNIRLIRIRGTGVRRGPASEAQTLFIDLDHPEQMPQPLE